MRSWWTRATIGALSVLYLLAPAVSAQVETPEAGAAAARYLPEAADLGDGWVLLPPQGVGDLPTDVFREAAVGYYGGPSGARSVVMVLIATSARIAVRQAWEEASSRYDSYRYRLGSDYQRVQELETIPPPEGCEEAKRSEGTDKEYGFPTAITLCAGSTDEIILVVVSGGDAETLGYQASDALAVLAIGDALDWACPAIRDETIDAPIPVRGVAGGWRDWWDDPDDSAELRDRGEAIERRQTRLAEVLGVAWRREIERERDGAARLCA
jgi:hypothetical protein